MERRWFIIYYETERKVSYIDEFIKNITKRERAKFFAILEALEEYGPNLPRPYADILTDGIHELRIKLTGKQYRILYFFCYKDFIVLTHTFIKKTDKVPIKEINKAKGIREEFLHRVKLKELEAMKNEEF